MKKNLSILFSIIILSWAMGFSVRFVFAQLGWEEPANTPPLDNDIPLWIKNGNNLYHTTGGNLGIGTPSPISPLHVVNEKNDGWLAQLDNTGTGADANGLLIKAGVDASDYILRLQNQAGVDYMS